MKGEFALPDTWDISVPTHDQRNMESPAHFLSSYLSSVAKEKLICSSNWHVKLDLERETLSAAFLDLKSDLPSVSIVAHTMEYNPGAHVLPTDFPQILQLSQLRSKCPSSGTL